MENHSRSPAFFVRAEEMARRNPILRFDFNRRHIAKGHLKTWSNRNLTQIIRFYSCQLVVIPFATTFVPLPTTSVGANSSGKIVIAIRRFFARPSGVALSATGRNSP